MDKARQAAAKAMVKMHKGGWVRLILNNILSETALDERDKSFAAALFYGTAERLVTLDELLKPLSKKPLIKLDIEVRAVLETGLYQIKYMRVPQSAAVNEAVKLVRTFGKSSASGFVNAVLRKAANAELPTVFETETKRVCAEYSVGEVVAKEIMQALPKHYDDFFKASFSVKKLCVRVNTVKTTQEELACLFLKQGIKSSETSIKNCIYVEEKGNITKNPLFEKGFYHVQGEASQYACECLKAKKGEKVLDLCAAPGGKTATLAQNVGGELAGEGVVSCEIKENKLPLIQETMKRLALNGVKILQNDASVFNEKFKGQNKVLCDVPCSGFGVLAKKPDIRYSERINFDELEELQFKILDTASKYVEKGGLIVYSTCTMRRGENADIVKRFLKENSKFAIVQPTNVPKLALNEDGMVTILPNYNGLDGFFVATLESL